MEISHVIKQKIIHSDLSQGTDDFRSKEYIPTEFNELRMEKLIDSMTRCAVKSDLELSLTHLNKMMGLL